MKSFELALHSGITIHLSRLNQWRTYEGLLEGLPTVESNTRQIEWILKTERNGGHNCYLIEAVTKPIKYNEARPYPFGTPAALPPIACVGRFTSRSPARDSKADASDLNIVWFQDEFAFPIDSNVLDLMRAIDWKTCARDFEY